MSSTITAARRRASSACLEFPCTRCSRLAFPARRRSKPLADQLPPIEVSPPEDQNRTRAKPIIDEGAGSRRVAPNVAPTSNRTRAGNRP